MPYASVPFKHITNVQARELFSRANGYLGDAYSMLGVHPRKGTNAGSCDFSVALVLICLLDAIAAYMYPNITGKGSQEKRFTKLIQEHLPWGSSSKWASKPHSAAWLYHEFRYPLAHNAGRDFSSKHSYGNFGEQKIGRWGHVPKRAMARIDGRQQWSDDWPVMELQRDQLGKRAKLSCVAFYWAVKKMVRELALSA